MKVIVHIGVEKTGTTTIQAVLDGNREHLSTQGIHVLRCAGRFNHRALPAFCLRDKRADDYLRARLLDSAESRQRFRQEFRSAFIKEIDQLGKNVHTVVISSEHFHSTLLHQDELETLKELLQSHFTEIRILVYLREQVDAMLSRFSTRIKAGGTIELSAFLQRCRTRKMLYNYHAMLENWEHVFGYDHIEPAIFSKNDFIEQDLVIDFMSRVSHVAVQDLNLELHIENESLSPTGQTVGRAINMAFPAFDDGIGVNPLRARLMELNAQLFRGRGSTIDAPTRESIEIDFAASNEHVRKQYFPERKQLFSGEASAEQQSTEEMDLAEALSEIFKLILADNNVVPQRYVDLFRNVAIKLEQDHLEKSYEMMNLAYRMRPDGPLIKAKREEYLARLESLRPGAASSRTNNGNK